jgi:hypothetical protein
VQQKGIIAYFVILILMVIAALYLSGSFLGGGAAGTTATTSIAANTTTIPVTTANSTSTTTSRTTTSITISQCQSRNATEKIFNGDFSLGNYSGWNSSGVSPGELPGFGDVPFNVIYANENNAYYNSPWSNYNGTHFATTYHNGLILNRGNLTSATFKVSELYLNFRIISPQSDQLYIEILDDGVPKIVAHYNTFAAQGVNNPLSTFVNASIPLVTLLCKNVSIRVHSGVVGTTVNKYSYMAVGDFYLSRVPVSTPLIVVNQTIV